MEGAITGIGMCEPALFSYIKRLFGLRAETRPSAEGRESSSRRARQYGDSGKPSSGDAFAAGSATATAGGGDRPDMTAAPRTCTATDGAISRAAGGPKGGGTRQKTAHRKRAAVAGEPRCSRMRRERKELEIVVIHVKQTQGRKKATP